MCAKIINAINPDLVTKPENWWEESIVQYAFNFPSVTITLDRLMGSNIVRMTDPSYMSELREKVWKDADANLTKRIERRKRMEIEREAQLILKGVYTNYNRPKKCIPLHSVALALDLGERKNAVSENAEKSNISHVFKINDRTNATINNRRLKLKSDRQKNVDHVIRQTKLEGLKPNIEYDELIAIETKIKEIEDKILGGKSKKSKRFMNKLSSNQKPGK